MVELRSRWLPTAIVLVGLVLTPALANAGPAIGLHGAYSFSEKEFGIGINGRLPLARLGAISEVAFYPNVDVYVFGDITLLSFDADLMFPIEVEALPIVPYPGVGIGVTYIDPGQETVLDLNLIAGLELDFGSRFLPFAEVEAALFGSDNLSFSFGFRIDIGSYEDEPDTTSPAAPSGEPNTLDDDL